jgi:oligoendopeptidase F
MAANRTSRRLAAAALAFAFLPALAFAQHAARERSAIDPRYTWDLSDLYASDEAWEADFEKAGAVAGELEGLRARLGKLDSGEKILDLHRTMESAELLVEKLYSYAWLKGDEDTRVSRYQGYKQQMQALSVRVETALAWVSPALVAIPREKMEKWLDRTEGLEIYRHWYDDLWRQQEYVLSEPEEAILSLAGEVTSTPGNVYDQMMNADLTFGTFQDENGEAVEMTQARYIPYMASPDRRVRRDAWDVYYQGYEKYIHAATESYAGAVKRDIFYTRARGYESCAQRALDADNVPLEVLENLIATVGANTDAVRRFHEIRARIMEVDTLQHWDTYVNLIPALDEEIPYEKAVETIVAGLAPLGPQYVADMRRGFESRWIDVYENTGKNDGAYSWGSAAAPHPYMLMNYESRMDDMFTLAHEMGHSMHTFYTVANQPQVYADYSLFVAEVASTTNEAILMHHLLGQPMDRDRRIFLLNQYIEKILGTVYTQVMFSEFEKRTHEMAERGEPLTVDALNAVYLELIAKYSGGAIHYGERSGQGWCRIGHFYRNFYVYKYATSYAAATALSKRIVDGEPGALEAYQRFLASGSSDYPIELLKQAGVDLSTPAPVQATCDLLVGLVDQLEGLLAEKSKT